MKHSLKDGSGYLVIDHTNSPGLRPEDVAHLPGAIAVEGGVKFEADIQQCSHCQAAVVLNPKRTRPRGYCAKCDHYICDNPVCNSGCKPIVSLLDNLLEHTVEYAGREDNPSFNPTNLVNNFHKDN